MDLFASFAIFLFVTGSLVLTFAALAVRWAWR